MSHFFRTRPDDSSSRRDNGVRRLEGPEGRGQDPSAAGSEERLLGRPSDSTSDAGAVLARPAPRRPHVPKGLPH